MAKKKFSEGLEGLFSDVYDTLEVGVMSELSVPSKSTKKPSAHKSFSSDLDALLQEALEESIDKMEQREHANSPNLSGKSKSTFRSMGADDKPAVGLDALIRQTIDIQDLTQAEEGGIRRLTVAVDRVKLDKLKTIAKLENSFLKDLLVGLIDEYIQGYRNKKGLEL